MAHNPYDPPAATVADVERVPPPVKPWQMKTALAFMWISFTCLVMPGFMHPGSMGSGFAPGVRSDFALVLTYLTLIGLLAGLLVFVGKGQRWARILYVAWVGTNLLRAFKGLPGAVPDPAFERLLYLLNLMMDVATAVLLFLPASNAWFHARRLARLAR